MSRFNIMQIALAGGFLSLCSGVGLAGMMIHEVENSREIKNQPLNKLR
jgi:hypothetical protein